LAGNRFTGIRQDKKPTRHFSKKQEKRGSELLGLRVTANSGATAFAKGDARDQNLLVEFKTLTKPQQSHSLKKEWFTKNQEEAFATGRRFSAVAFDFGDGEDYIAVSTQDFKEFYDAWKTLYSEEET
jgi:hypothetical protein